MTLMREAFRSVAYLALGKLVVRDKVDEHAVVVLGRRRQTAHVESVNPCPQRHVLDEDTLTRDL